MNEIIKAYRAGAKSPRPKRVLYVLLAFVLGLAVGTRCEAQQIVITNENATDEILLVYYSAVETGTDVEFRFPVKANTTTAVPMPAGSTFGVDKDGPSWGFSGGIPAPGPNQTTYIFIRGTATYPANGVFQTFNTQSYGGPPADVAGQLELWWKGVILGSIIGASVLAMTMMRGGVEGSS